MELQCLEEKKKAKIIDMRKRVQWSIEGENLWKCFTSFIIGLPKRAFTLMWWRDKKKGK